MNSAEYISLNRIIVLAGSSLVLFFVLLSFSGTPTCIHLIYTGQDCNSCGVTRDVLSFLQFDFSNPINTNSYRIFAFGVLQFLYRSYISILNRGVISEAVNSADLLYYQYPCTKNKSRVISIKKVIITDAMITFLCGVLAFLPFWRDIP